MAFTPPGRLALEALVVALGLVVLFFAVHVVFMRFAGDRAMTDHGLLAAQLAISGAAFHVLCEYSRINEWYCAQRK